MSRFITIEKKFIKGTYQVCLSNTSNLLAPYFFEVQHPILVVVETIEERAGIAVIVLIVVVRRDNSAFLGFVFRLKPFFEFFECQRAVVILVSFFEAIESSLLGHLKRRQWLCFEAFGVRHCLKHGQKVVGELLTKNIQNQAKECTMPVSKKLEYAI